MNELIGRQCAVDMIELTGDTLKRSLIVRDLIDGDRVHLHASVTQCGRFCACYFVMIKY